MSLRCPCRLSRSFLYCASPSSIHRVHKHPKPSALPSGIPIDPPEIIAIMLQTSGQKTTTWDGAKTLENHGKKTLPNWKPPDFLKPPTGDQVTQFGGSKTKKEPTRFLQRPLKASPNGLPFNKPLRPLEKPRKSWLVGKNIGIRNFSKKKNRPMNTSGYGSSSPTLTAFRTEVNWSLLKCYIQCGGCGVVA